LFLPFFYVHLHLLRHLHVLRVVLLEQAHFLDGKEEGIGGVLLQFNGSEKG
jgi:hypothetical protein